MKDERPDARVWATDLSPDAVELARANATRLGLDVDVRVGDLFDGLPAELRGALDLVVANPPYVPTGARTSWPRTRSPIRRSRSSVTSRSPSGSLGAALVWLRPGGAVVQEIEEDTGSAMTELARRGGFVEPCVLARSEREGPRPRGGEARWALRAAPPRRPRRPRSGASSIVFPTDTVYGIGTRPDDPDATGRALRGQTPAARPDAAGPRPHAARRRAPSRGSTSGSNGSRSRPGRVRSRSSFRARPGPPVGARRGRDQIGVRLPAHPLALAILAASGPLAVTSANRSGAPPATTCDELEEAFGALVRVYLCSDEPLVGAPSTVVDLTGHGPAVLREGAVAADEIARLWVGEDPLLDSGPS